MIGQIGNDGTDNVDYATTIDRNGSVDGTGPFREGTSSGATFADFDQNYTAINTGSTGEAGAGSGLPLAQHLPKHSTMFCGKLAKAQLQNYPQDQELEVELCLHSQRPGAAGVDVVC